MPACAVEAVELTWFWLQALLESTDVLSNALYTVTIIAYGFLCNDCVRPVTSSEHGKVPELSRMIRLQLQCKKSSAGLEGPDAVPYTAKRECIVRLLSADRC